MNSKTKLEKFYELRCVKCGKIWDEKETSASCLNCGSPLEIDYDWDYIKSRLNYYNLKHSPISAMKYLGFYPILDLNRIVSLEEGGTHLRKSKRIAKRLGLDNLYFKDETSNPTGGFKDRGTMVEITKAMEMNAKAVIVASTGNMAASVAAYAVQAGIPAYIVVPEGTPIGKLSQTLAYGARVIQVRATYSECAKLAEEIAKKYGFYLAGDYVFRGEGQKSQGYEIVEQLSWQSPDYLIAPIGCGTNIHAIYKGIKEFYKLGLIDKLPKVVGVQPVGANTIVEAFKKKTRKIKPILKPTTVASAVAVGYPLDGLKILNDIYETKGMAIEVTDEEILKAEKELANNESIFVEPSAALPLAALHHLVDKHIVKKADTVVCVLTGNGLKDPISMLRILPSPPSIEPKIEEVDHYLKMKLYNIQGTVEKDKLEIVWKKAPSERQINKLVGKEFRIDLTKKYLVSLHREVKNFFDKENVMRKSDLQHMIEDTLKVDPEAKKIIEVVDFDVKTSRHKKAQAYVKIQIEGNGLCQNSAEGVGPVDAIMKAVEKVIQKEKLLNYWLTDFDVKIDRKGTDATVEVSMALKDAHDNKVISTATSPDVIVASVNAFERGYNILYNKSKKKQ